MGVKRPEVRLHIGRLVLEGVAPRHEKRLGGAVARELTRLIRERGVPASWLSGGATPAIDAGSFAVKGRVTGIELARALYGGLKR